MKTLVGGPFRIIVPFQNLQDGKKMERLINAMDCDEPARAPVPM